MHRIARKVLAVELALFLVVPGAARADDPRASIAPRPVIGAIRAPPSLDLPPRVVLLDPAIGERRWLAGPLAPGPRKILSEEGIVLVVASIIVGTVILVYLVSTATKSH